VSSVRRSKQTQVALCYNKELSSIIGLLVRD
jgi:hypothetical protein